MSSSSSPPVSTHTSLSSSSSSTTTTTNSASCSSLFTTVDHHLKQHVLGKRRAFDARLNETNEWLTTELSKMKSLCNELRSREIAAAQITRIQTQLAEMKERREKERVQKEMEERVKLQQQQAIADAKRKREEEEEAAAAQAAAVAAAAQAAIARAEEEAKAVREAAAAAIAAAKADAEMKERKEKERVRKEMEERIRSQKEAEERRERQEAAAAAAIEAAARAKAAKIRDTYELSDTEVWSEDEEAEEERRAARKPMQRQFDTDGMEIEFTDDGKRLPRWAWKRNLSSRLQEMYASRMDPDTIFPPIAPNVDLEMIFAPVRGGGGNGLRTPAVKPRKPRGSSAKWSRDKLKNRENMAYKKEMGYVLPPPTFL